MVGAGVYAAAVKRLRAPRSLKATKVLANGVTLKWAAPKGAKPAQYVVLRDGKAIGKTKRTTFTDGKVKAGKTYRYTVRALDSRKRAGALSASVRVKVPEARRRSRRRRRTTTTPPLAPVGSDAGARLPRRRPGRTAAAADGGDGRAAVLARRVRRDARRSATRGRGTHRPSSSTGS